jgi:hypothetical protein
MIVKHSFDSHYKLCINDAKHEEHFIISRNNVSEYKHILNRLNKNNNCSILFLIIISILSTGNKVLVCSNIQLYTHIY